MHRLFPQLAPTPSWSVSVGQFALGFDTFGAQLKATPSHINPRIDIKNTYGHTTFQPLNNIYLFILLGRELNPGQG